MEILAKVCEALQLWYVAKVAAIIFVTTVIAYVAMELIARSRSARKLFISFGRYLENRLTERSRSSDTSNALR